jgi:hypothetical protein
MRQRRWWYKQIRSLNLLESLRADEGVSVGAVLGGSTSTC